MWRNNKTKIHQPVQSNEKKLTYLRKQVNFNETCIHLGSNNSKTKLETSLINYPPPQPPLTNNIINYLIYKPLKNLSELILIKPTQSLSTFQFLYHFWNHIILKILFSTPNIFNFGQNSHMGRGACAGRFNLSLTSGMPNFWQWNYNPGEIQKSDRRTKILGDNLQ